MTSALPPTTPPPVNPPAGEQPSPPPGAPARPQLLRSGTDRMAGGVCGGLAEYSGIDSLLWRVGFVGLTIAGGAGIVIYLFLWVLMPSAPLPADTWPSPVERLVERLHQAVSGAMASGRRD
jgi:phage shock protein C